MPGVYGDMLSAFPELLKDYEVFSMPPRIGAGYGQRYNKRIVTGYLSWQPIKEREVTGGLLANNQQAVFYEQHDFFTNKSQIEQGDFVEVKGEIYVFTGSNRRGEEGGFSKWVIRLVTGPTDQQQRDPAVDLAAGF
jgi:hypothetical protein